MERQYQKKSYALFRVWLAAFAAAMIFFVLRREIFPLIGSGKNAGILSLVFLDLLFVLILATQSVYWIGGITFEEAAGADAGARRRFALRHLAVFLAATAVFLVYCFGMKNILQPDHTRDSLVAGGTVCAAAVICSRFRL